VLIIVLLTFLKENRFGVKQSNPDAKLAPSTFR